MAFTHVPTLEILLVLVVQVLFAIGAMWLAGRAFELGMLQFNKKKFRFSNCSKRRLAMRKIWRVFKYEFMSVVSRRSFILGLILVPLLPTIIIGLVSLLKPKDSPDLVKTIVKEVSTTKPYGVVDESGLINDYPNWAMGGQLIPFEDESLARQETQAGNLDGFYVVSADYLETGDVLLVKPEVSMVAEMAYNATFEELIRYNLVDGNDELYAKLVNHVKVTTEYLDIEQADTRDQKIPVPLWCHSSFRFSSTCWLSSIQV